MWAWKTDLGRDGVAPHGGAKRRWLYGDLLAALLACPTLILSYGTGTDASSALNDPNTLRAWAGIMHTRGPLHFYPLSAGWLRNVMLALVLGITVAVGLQG